MKKMQNIAKLLDVVFKVLFWVIIVFCIGFVILNVVKLLGGNDLIQSENARLVLNLNGLSVSGDVISAINFDKAYIVFAVLFVLMCGFGLYGIYTIRQILSPMKNGKPFSPNTSKSFTCLGWLTIVFGIVLAIVKWYSQHLIISQIPNINMGIDATYTVKYTFDVTFILVAALLFLFSFVFKYGEELQQLSDETL